MSKPVTLILLQVLIASNGCKDQSKDEFSRVRRPALQLESAPSVFVHLFAPIGQTTGIQWRQQGEALDSQTAFSGPSQVAIRVNGAADTTIDVVGGLLTQRSGELIEVQFYLARGSQSLDEVLRLLRKAASTFNVAESDKVQNYFLKVTEEQPNPSTSSVRLVNVLYGQKGLLSLGIRPAPTEDGWYPQAWIGPARYFPDK